MSKIWCFVAKWVQLLNCWCMIWSFILARLVTSHHNNKPVVIVIRLRRQSTASVNRVLTAAFWRQLVHWSCKSCAAGKDAISLNWFWKPLFFWGWYANINVVWSDTRHVFLCLWFIVACTFCHVLNLQGPDFTWAPILGSIFYFFAPASKSPSQQVTATTASPMRQANTNPAKMSPGNRAIKKKKSKADSGQVHNCASLSLPWRQTDKHPHNV